ncbi:hypothetical protein FO519_004777 [Halicephalobus sp. NKZ332]|nr:hypothetical protein FO519_004777 [Halicephalobus sp. NKZ332]
MERRSSTIGVVTSDNIVFNVELELLCHSLQLKRILENHPDIDDEFRVVEGAEPLRLRKTRSDVFQAILEWLQHHQKDTPLTARNNSLLPQGFNLNINDYIKSPPMAKNVSPKKINESNDGVEITEMTSIAPQTAMCYQVVRDDGKYVIKHEERIIELGSLKNDKEQFLGKPIGEFEDDTKKLAMREKAKAVKDALNEMKAVDFEPLHMNTNLPENHPFTELVNRVQVFSEFATSRGVDAGDESTQDPVEDTLDESDIACLNDEDEEFQRALTFFQKREQTRQCKRKQTALLELPQLIPKWDVEFFAKLPKPLLFQIIKTSNNLAIYQLNRNACIYVALKMGKTPEVMSRYLTLNP